MFVTNIEFLKVNARASSLTVCRYKPNASTLFLRYHFHLNVDTGSCISFICKTGMLSFIMLDVQINFLSSLSAFTLPERVFSTQTLVITMRSMRKMSKCYAQGGHGP